MVVYIDAEVAQPLFKFLFIHGIGVGLVGEEVTHVVLEEYSTLHKNKYAIPSYSY